MYIPTVVIQENERKTICLSPYFKPNVPVRFKGYKNVIPTYEYQTQQLTLTPKRDWVGLENIVVVTPREKGIITVRITRRIEVEFKYITSEKVKNVYVAGEFNNWNPKATPMVGPDEYGEYKVSIELAPGRYQYKFVVDGKWIRDPANPLINPDGFGGFNSVIQVGAERTPVLMGIYRHVSARTYKFGILFSGGTLDRNSVSVIMDDTILKTWKAKGNKIEITVKDLSKGVHKFKVNAANKDHIYAKELVFEEMVDVTPTFDWHDAVVYFAMTDRFCNGDPTNDYPLEDPELDPKANYQGGDFQGIINKIKEGYFSKLGINTIWISPVNAGPDSAHRDALPPHRKFSNYHGYWPCEPYKVEKRFGNMDKLKELVRVAHAHGIKIMLDLVLNHVHEKHPFYRKHPDWFLPLYTPDGRKNIRLFDEFPLTTWFDEFLPSFDFSNKEPRDTVIENAIWWIKETDADAARLDAVKHMPHIFWREFRSRLRDEVEAHKGIRFYLVGETISDREKIAEYVNPGELDGQFDYPLYWVIRDVFAFNTAGFDKLERALESSENIYGSWAIMAQFLGSHDFARFMFYADTGAISSKSAWTAEDEKEIGWKNPPEVKNPNSYKKLRLAFTFLMTINGAPLIFYGDEFGMTGAGDPDNRRFMRFGEQLSEQEKETLAYVSKLLQIRRNCTALRRGAREPLLVNKDVYAYRKVYFDSCAIVVLNKASESKTISIPVEGKLWKDAMSSKLLEAKNGKISVPIEPLKGKIYILQN